MKFYEKLIILRKKALLSQEALAEKLDVTRQTISKWELDQTKPDMDKLKEISKLFDIDINVLTDDTISLEDNKSIKKQDNKQPRKIILYVVIIIFIASLVTLLYRVGSDIKLKVDARNEEIQKLKDEEKKKKQEVENKIKEQQEKIEQQQKENEQQQKENEKKRKINSFNSDFEFYQGTVGGTSTSYQIDNVIKSNKKNTDHLVEVIFDGISYGTDPDKIKEIKNSLKDFNGYNLQYYEISIDYDDNGYVNKITIETR